MNSPHAKSMILTLRIDQSAQQYFDALRKAQFPPERNFLSAHLTLFHQLPDEADTIKLLEQIHLQPFALQVVGLLHLGRGEAYRIESNILQDLHHELSAAFEMHLTAQDRQKFRPHITIQNKVNPEDSKTLFEKLQVEFAPFEIQAEGLDLWHYLNPHWAHAGYYAF